ncbi:MAG: hypothetical protein ABW167_09560 [Baekduia sp.]
MKTRVAWIVAVLCFVATVVVLVAAPWIGGLNPGLALVLNAIVGVCACFVAWLCAIIL